MLYPRKSCRTYNVLYCCSTSWVRRLVREGWSFGRSVGGWASGFVVMCGSRVLQYCFLNPWCFHHSLDDGALRSNWIHIYCYTSLPYQGTAVAHGGWVVRLVSVSMGSWVRGWVVASVRTSMIVRFCYCCGC